MRKVWLLATAFLAMIVICGQTVQIEIADATFTHTWTMVASGGIGSSPVSNKECGLWDNAPGATGSSSGNGAVLWIECDNGGDGGGPSPYENEWCRWRTTQVDVDPVTGYRYLRIRYCRQNGITFRVRVTYSVAGMVMVLSDGNTTTWQTLVLTLSTTNGRVQAIFIEIDDTSNYTGYVIDTYMVLIDYISLRNAAGSIIWSENF